MTTEIRNYSWEYKGNNNILIYEQEKEDENTYNCISHIIEQLKKENKNFIFHLKKTMKDNKLIAEFMGEQPKSILSKGKIYKDYSKSWDWLMPVVEKCLIGEAEQEGFICHDIYDGLTNISLSETHNAVVKFIKEYNNDNR